MAKTIQPAISDRIYKPAPWGAWILAGIVTSILGFPTWCIGVITNVEGLQGFWGKFAKGLVELFYGKQNDAPEPSPKVEDYIQHQLDKDNLLNIATCVDGYYLRFIRHVNEQGFVSRIDLTGIVPGELQALGLENDLDSALHYTLRQIDRGIFSKVFNPDHPPIPKAELKPEAPPVTSQNQPTASKAVAPKAKETAEPKGQDRKKAFEGKVIFAGNKTHRPPGRAPYSTFTVRLRANDGSEQEFSGVDLESRFEGDNAQFSVGDTVRIVHLGKQPVEVESEGEGHEVRHRNQFAVSKA